MLHIQVSQYKTEVHVPTIMQTLFDFERSQFNLKELLFEVTELAVDSYNNA